MDELERRDVAIAFWEEVESYKGPKETDMGFADRIGVNRGTIRYGLLGAQPKLHTIVDVGRRLGINFRELLRRVPR